MTARIPTTSKIEFFSKMWCRVQNDILCSSFRRLKSKGRRSSDRRELLRLADPHRHPEIIGHDQRADQEQGTSRGSNDVERMHRFNRFDEGIFKKAERGVCSPHQALKDSRDPHRRDVEDDTDGRDPEMPVHELQAVNPLAIPYPGHEAI